MSGRTVVTAVLTAVAAATVYDVLVAVNVIKLGEVPGEGPPAGELVRLIVATAIAASAVFALIVAPRGNRVTALAAGLAPAAAVFMVARFYTYDPYYLPSLVRQSEKDFVSPLVVYALGALCVGVGLVTLTRRAAGLVLTVPAVLLCGLVSAFSGAGH